MVQATNDAQAKAAELQSKDQALKDAEERHKLKLAEMEAAHAQAKEVLQKSREVEAGESTAERQRQKDTHLQQTEQAKLGHEKRLQALIKKYELAITQAREGAEKGLAQIKGETESLLQAREGEFKASLESLKSAEAARIAEFSAKHEKERAELLRSQKEQSDKSMGELAKQREAHEVRKCGACHNIITVNSTSHALAHFPDGEACGWYPKIT